MFKNLYGLITIFASAFFGYDPLGRTVWSDDQRGPAFIYIKQGNVAENPKVLRIFLYPFRKPPRGRRFQVFWYDSENSLYRYHGGSRFVGTPREHANVACGNDADYIREVTGRSEPNIVRADMHTISPSEVDPIEPRIARLLTAHRSRVFALQGSQDAFIVYRRRTHDSEQSYSIVHFDGENGHAFEHASSVTNMGVDDAVAEIVGYAPMEPTHISDAQLSIHVQGLEEGNSSEAIMDAASRYLAGIREDLGLHTLRETTIRNGGGVGSASSSQPQLQQIRRSSNNAPDRHGPNPFNRPKRGLNLGSDEPKEE